MPHLERRPTGWRIAWREDGQRRSSILYRTKTEAAADLLAIDQRMALARPPRHLVIPLPELVARYLAHCAAESRSRGYQSAVAKALARCIAADQRTTSDLRPGATATDQRILRAFVRWCRREHRQPVPDQVDRAPRAAKRRPRDDLLTSDQVDQMVAAAARWHPGNAALAHLIATYGHRAESLIELSPDALRADHLILRVKSGDTMRHPLTPATQAILRPLATSDDAKRQGRLLPCHLGRPWKSGQEYAAWWSHAISGRDGSPRAGILGLRRYAISRMLASGLDAVTVASITGHRTVSLLLNTYGRTSAQRQAQAVRAIAGTGGADWPQLPELGFLSQDPS